MCFREQTGQEHPDLICVTKRLGGSLRFLRTEKDQRVYFAAWGSKNPGNGPASQRTEAELEEEKGP